MDAGLIFHPYMRPGRTARQTIDWGVRNAVQCDGIGFTSMLVGEHATGLWENVPAPELLFAAAALQTERIVFAPMVHLLPHQHPTRLAIIVGWLSQILEGRYFLGIGAGADPQSSYMHGIRNSRDRVVLDAMLSESLDIMEKIWKREPFFHEGQFWDAGFPDEVPALDGKDALHKLGNFAPWNGVPPEIAVTGLSGKSPTMRLAGERNFKPISIYSGPDALRMHWDIYCQAATRAGHTPIRQRHSVCLTVFVADTDAEARKLVMEGPIGDCANRYLVPLWRRFGLMDGFAKDAGIDPADADLSFIVDNVFIVGSANTVAEKIGTLFERCGGWGTLQVETYDYYDDPSPWFESLEWIAKEVAPRIGLLGKFDDTGKG